jgi:hypothetical protein
LGRESRIFLNGPNEAAGAVIYMAGCLPDKAIMSVCDRLLAAKMAVSWSRPKDGGGSFPSTLVDVELSPSSLPSSTAYDGPPA